MTPSSDPDIDIHPLIQKRWSPRSFSDKPVEKNKLLTLFEAARRAPSSFNEQPWRFIVATKDYPEDFKTLFECLTEGNRKWADNAAVLMLSVARMFFERNGKPNRHAFHDEGLATGNLLLQATALSLFVHQMAGFDHEKAREVLHIPEGFDPVAAMALGYVGDPSDLPEELEKRERSPSRRKEIPEIIFSGTWGRSFP